jgi:glycosyltransferase involved in cell wall biosynthesis
VSAAAAPERILISHPVHQHAYETAVAASQAGLLECFVTGLYWTGTGVTDPRYWRWLPSGVARSIDRELRRRHHPQLHSGNVRVIARYHAPATLLRRTLRGLPGMRDLNLDRWATRGFDRAVARMVRQLDQLGLVHTFEGGASRTLRAARQIGLRTILDVPSAYERFLELDLTGRRLSHACGPEVAQERELADLLLAPSDFVVSSLLEAGVPDSKIVKLPYGVDPSTFRPLPNRGGEGPFRALFVGQIGLRKGVCQLLEAWRRLGLADAELVLVGRPDRAGRRLLAQYDGTYRWVSALPRHEINWWFQHSDLFVFPSLAEGSAYVTYEAMSSGLPLVTTPNSGSVARDGLDGYLVPARDVDAICEKVQRLYDDPDQRRAMGASARARIQDRYTWRHYHHRLAAAYRALLAGQPIGVLD